MNTSEGGRDQMQENLNKEVFLSILSGIPVSNIRGNIVEGMIAEAIRIAVYTRINDDKLPAHINHISNWVVRKLRCVIPEVRLNSKQVGEVLKDDFYSLANVGEFLKAENGIFYPTRPVTLDIDRELSILISGLPTRLFVENGFKVYLNGIKRTIKKPSQQGMEIERMSPEIFFRNQGLLKLEEFLLGNGEGIEDMSGYLFLRLGGDEEEWIQNYNESTYANFDEVCIYIATISADDEQSYFIIKKRKIEHKKWDYVVIDGVKHITNYSLFERHIINETQFNHSKFEVAKMNGYATFFERLGDEKFRKPVDVVLPYGVCLASKLYGEIEQCDPIVTIPKNAYGEFIKVANSFGIEMR